MPSTSAVPSAPPYIVIIYADDLGFGDLGCFGANGISTPNLAPIHPERVRAMSALLESIRDRSNPVT
jgi:arylsulfatase A-like enzyme